MVKSLCVFCFMISVFTVVCYGMFPTKSVDDSILMSSVPNTKENKYGLISSGSQSENRVFGQQSVLSGKVFEKNLGESFTYMYDDSIANRLDLSLFQKSSLNDVVLKDYKFSQNISKTAKALNINLASIYSRYIEKTNIPVKDPLWLIAIGSVEYNYSSNSPDIIFSFPIDLQEASKSSNYLLQYDWNEVKRIGGESAVLRREGSSIGILQITSGFGEGIEPVIPEEFGIIGAANGRRSDCWLSLENKSSGSSIIWKHGVNGDRWSPADNANITYAVYDAAIKRYPLSKELISKYEKVILLMWAHNRGTGIINDQYYIDKSRELAKYVSELQKFVEALKPARFTRSGILNSKCQEISNKVTEGDTYPVMALVSYLITENRYGGKW